MANKNLTTSDVRETYQASEDGLDFKSAHESRGEDFDAWLDRVKYEAFERGRAEGYEQGYDIGYDSALYAFD